jgi:hypothetical protein
VFRVAVEYFGNWPDSEETAVRLARRLVDEPLDFRGAPWWLPLPSVRQAVLSRALASRGHLAEAYAAYPDYPLSAVDRSSSVYPELALLGGIPVDSAAATFERRLAGELEDALRPLRRALPWWLSQGDSLSLARFAGRLDSAAGTAGGSGRASMQRDAAEARAYVTLIRRDSAAALRQLQALDDSICVVTTCGRGAFLIEARLLAAARRLREALALLDQYFHYETDLLSVLAMLERARIAEALGDRERANGAYLFVVDTWRNGDAEVQSYVGEARQALQRLGGEPTR